MSHDQLLRAALTLDPAARVALSDALLEFIDGEDVFAEVGIQLHG